VDFNLIMVVEKCQVTLAMKINSVQNLVPCKPPIYKNSTTRSYLPEALSCN